MSPSRQENIQTAFDLLPTPFVVFLPSPLNCPYAPEKYLPEVLPPARPKSAGKICSQTPHGTILTEFGPRPAVPTRGSPEGQQKNTQNI